MKIYPIVFEDDFLILSLDARISAPDRPNLFFVSRLSIVCEECCGKRTRSPSELKALFVLPAFEHSVKKSAYKSVAAAYSVKDVYLARLCRVPVVSRKHYRTPDVCVDIYNLSECGGKYLGVREFFFNAGYHAFEAVDFRCKVASSGFWSFNSECKLEVFFVSYKNIGN